MVRHAFTLIELLVVILIIGLVTVVALPTVVSTASNRQLGEAGRVLQGALVGARDKAVHDGAPSGIRLLPDPAFPLAWTAGAVIDPTRPLAYNRVVPIGPAPEYNEGFATTIPVMAVRAQVGLSSPVAIAPNVVFSWPGMPSAIPPALVLVSSPADPSTGLVNPPTSWSWNVRVGDRIQIGGAGPWYTIVGPAAFIPGSSGGVGNPEFFVNAGAPGPISGLPVPRINEVPVEYLLLANGRDDGPMGAMGNPDGWIDSGWDGADNNGNGMPDEYGEWENEAWLGGAASGSLANIPYTIRRRPAPLPGAREVALPAGMVIDATTWNATRERSRLPVDQSGGFVDILLNPDGTVLYNSPYATPSGFGMGDAFYHFWLADRGDVMPPDVTTRTSAPYLPTPPGVTPGRFASGAEIKGHYSILTLFARTGQIAVDEMPPFLFDPSLGYNSQSGTYNPGNPFIPAEQGIRGAP